MTISEKIDKKKVSTFIVTPNGMLIQGDVYMIPEIKLFEELNVEQRKFLAVAGAKIYPSFSRYPHEP